jgi:hypothetical protein
MARPRSPWPAILLLGAIAAAIYGATSIGWHTRPSPAGSRNPEQAEPVSRVSICVTNYSLCSWPPARVGDPCVCPHPLRGLVPGHVELEGGEPAIPGSRDWSERENTRELYDWESLVGP